MAAASQRKAVGRYALARTQGAFTFEETGLTEIAAQIDWNATGSFARISPETNGRARNIARREPTYPAATPKPETRPCASGAATSGSMAL